MSVFHSVFDQNYAPQQIVVVPRERTNCSIKSVGKIAVIPISAGLSPDMPYLSTVGSDIKINQKANDLSTSHSLFWITC